MAVLFEINTTGINTVGTREAALRILARQFWLWFFNNQDQKVTTVKIWFISRTVYVRDLRSIFIMLFGEPPQ